MAAFGLGAGAVLLWSTFRRTEQHRDALIGALARIEELEANVAALTFGRADALEAPEETPAIAQQAAPRAITQQKPVEPAEAPPPFAAAAEPAPAEQPPEPVAAEAEDSSARAPLFTPRLDWAAIGSAGAALLALAALRLGFLPPIAAASIVALSGAGALGAALWRALQAPSSAAGWLGALGAGLIAIGIVCARLTLPIDPRAALAAALALAAIALALRARLGDVMMAVALLIGFLAPLLAPLDAIGAPIRHAGLAALLALVILSARERAIAPFAWAAFIGALGWAFAPAGADWIVALSASAYALLIGLFALVYGLEAARGARPLTSVLRAPPPEPLVVSSLAAIAAALALLVTALNAGAAAGNAIIALAALSAAALGAAAFRPGYAAAGAAVFALSLAALVFWPTDAPLLPIGFAAAAFALIACLAGALAFARGHAFGPVLIALGPLAALAAAQSRAMPLLPPLSWAAIAAAFALPFALAFLRWRTLRAPAAQMFAAGATLAAAAALGFATPAPWPPATLALCLAALAFLGRAEPGLRVATALLALMLAPLVALSSFGAAPLPARIAIDLAAVAAAYLAAWRFALEHPVARSSQTLYVAALAVAALALSMETRRAFAGEAPTLAEIGAHGAVWLGVALMLMREFGARPPPLIWASEAAAFALGAAALLIGGLVWVNPWWGLAPAAAPGWQIANALAFAFLGPALLLGFYAWRRERSRQPARAGAALVIALVLLFTHLTLELRRTFHGPAMAGAEIGYAEAWAYTLAWIGFAAALLLLAIERGIGWARHASLAVALLALAKGALFDLGGLSGLMQIGAFAGLGAAGAGLILLYRRFVLPLPPRAAKTFPNAKTSP